MSPEPILQKPKVLLLKLLRACQPAGRGLHPNTLLLSPRWSLSAADKQRRAEGNQAVIAAIPSCLPADTSLQYWPRLGRSQEPQATLPEPPQLTGQASQHCWSHNYSSPDSDSSHCGTSFTPGRSFQLSKIRKGYRSWLPGLPHWLKQAYLLKRERHLQRGS